jgi:uncharacterized membrane protein YfcA
MDVGLVFILMAVFLASAFNTAFGFGGIFLLSGVLSFMLPITDVLPMQTALMVSSQISRCVLLKSHIDWRFVRAFGIGSMIGALPGALLYQQLSSDVITLMIAGFMLWSAWAPKTKFTLTIPFGNVLTGAVHTFLSTAFSFGSLIQATLFRQGLSRTTVTATIALSMLVMSMFKIPAYAMTGFDYSLYFKEIILGSLVAPFGAMVGKPLLLNMSERMFMAGFKVLLTTVAVKLIWSVMSP